MTIDEAIRFANCLKNNYTIDFNDMESFCDTAIDTMRKHQRIQEIVKAWNDMNSFDSMAQISEVVEDGKSLD